MASSSPRLGPLGYCIVCHIHEDIYRNTQAHDPVNGALSLIYWRMCLYTGEQGNMMKEQYHYASLYI